MDDQEPPVRWAITRRFARAARSAGTIRSWLRGQLSAARVPSDVVDIAELLVSEVAANAVQHGAGDEITVHLAGDGYIETAVHDKDTTGSPRPDSAAPDDVRGRGLAMVQALATSWGTRPSKGGKWVWFRLSTRPDQTPPVHQHLP